MKFENNKISEENWFRCNGEKKLPKQVSYAFKKDILYHILMEPTDQKRERLIMSFILELNRLGYKPSNTFLWIISQSSYRLLQIYLIQVINLVRASLNIDTIDEIEIVTFDTFKKTLHEYLVYVSNGEYEFPEIGTSNLLNNCKEYDYYEYNPEESMYFNEDNITIIDVE